MPKATVFNNGLSNSVSEQKCNTIDIGTQTSACIFDKEPFVKLLFVYIPLIP